jgi:predicted NUDIX family NTP pyrophosphohydrolase
MKRSAGLLPFRRREVLEVLIGHPGGPFFAGKDAGHWSLIKGEIHDGEDMEIAAGREFNEETGWDPPKMPWIDLGEVKLRSGKLVRAFGVEAEFEPEQLRPGTFTVFWRGRMQSFPEIDQVRWCPPTVAKRLLNPAQSIFIERLHEKVMGEPESHRRQKGEP